MFQKIKYWLLTRNSSKYVLKGHCLKCGNCCRNILFYVNDIPISTEEQFASLKKYSKSYNYFYISGRDENGNLLFTCKALSENNKCKVYFMRSVDCRRYPKINKNFVRNGGVMLEGCGYYIDVDKDFKSYLK